MNRCQKKIIFFIFVTTTLPVLTLECWNLHPHQENPNSLFCENISQLLLVTHLPTKDIKNFSLRILMLSTNTWKAVQHQKLLVSSVTQSYATLCDPMNHSTPGVPVYHQLPEFIQTHVHGVDDVIQTSHPLSSPTPPTTNSSQHQGLFQWVNSSHEVNKVLQFQLQHQSFQCTPRTDLLQDGLVGSLYSPRDSQEPSPTPQFKSNNSPVRSFL